MKTYQEGGFKLQGLNPFPNPAKPKISVITIVFNGEKYLEHTIKSVLEQEYSNLEYILVDGGSTDDTLDIIKKYENKIAYWISEKDKGISDAFNKGINLTTGDIVGIINADDWYEPNTFEVVIQNYKPDSLIHGNMQYWNVDGTKGMLVKPNDTLIRREMTINHPTVFVSRSLYQQHGSFSTNYKLAMDYHFLLRLHRKNIPFIFIDATLSNMRSGGYSSNWKQSYREVRNAKDELLGSSAHHRLFYNWQVARRVVSEFLANTPLSFINKIYRAYLSPMKKK